MSGEKNYLVITVVRTSSCLFFFISDGLYWKPAKREGEGAKRRGGRVAPVIPKKQQFFENKGFRVGLSVTRVGFQQLGSGVQIRPKTKADGHGEKGEENARLC